MPDWLSSALAGLHVVLGIVVIAAVVYSLVKHRWLRALGQVLLAGFAALIFVFGFIAFSACLFAFQVFNNFAETEQPWFSTAICEELPFSVEYQPSHPFLAEYNKRIAFKSGKRIPICLDPGGVGDFAVYMLEEGCYYLIDGLDFVWGRSEYRVDHNGESVERKCGKSWMRIPDGTISVGPWSDTFLSVKTTNGEELVESGMPVGDSLKGKRFIGMVTPGGHFIPGGKEPSIEEDTITWTASQITDTVPFSYERGESRTKKPYCRFAFKSGKTVGIYPDLSEGRHSIYRQQDGRFLFASQEGTMRETLYRIDVANEVVWRYYCGYWVTIPEGALSICSLMADSTHVVIEIETEFGKEEVYGDEFAESVYLGATYIGQMDSMGGVTESRNEVFEAAMARTRMPGADWSAEAEIEKLNELYEGHKNYSNSTLGTFKKRITEMPGWYVAWSGSALETAYKVYHGEEESCIVGIGLHAARSMLVIQPVGRSGNRAAARYAAAIAAQEELKSLAK